MTGVKLPGWWPDALIALAVLAVILLLAGAVRACGVR